MWLRMRHQSCAPLAVTHGAVPRGVCRSASIGLHWGLSWLQPFMPLWQHHMPAPMRLQALPWHTTQRNVGAHQWSHRYGELLREIRLGNVRRVAFFENDEIMDDREQFQPVEGPCLVIFRDQRIAHSFMPRYDYRIPCAPLLFCPSRLLHIGTLATSGAVRGPASSSQLPCRARHCKRFSLACSQSFQGSAAKPPLAPDINMMIGHC